MPFLSFNPNLLPDDEPDAALRAKHEGVPVLNHPANAQADEEWLDGAVGNKAHQAVNALFDSLFDVEDTDYGD